MVEYAGYHMPVQVSGVSLEHQAVRHAVGLFDVSHMGRLRLEGEDAVARVNHLNTNDLARIADGGAVYTCTCDESGGIVDDLIVYRLAPGRVLVVCNAANRDSVVSHFRQYLAPRAESPGAVVMTDVTEETGLLAVQGPRALRLATLLGASPSLAKELRRFRLAPAVLAGFECTLARTGYTGEDGVEVFCAAEHAVELWRALLREGEPLGALPIGLAARDTLRLEACLSLYGNEIDRGTHPFEAGLGWTVKLDKGDFVGREALARIAATAPVRKLVGFEMTGRGIARHGYAISSPSGEPLGTCTSGAPSPTLGKNVGLGYVSVEHARTGCELLVDCRGRSVSAVVVDTPFYRRSPA
jgi:aminomethyltransferase